MRNKSVMLAASFAAGLVASPAIASDTLVKFDRSFGVTPTAFAGGVAVANDVSGIPPGGRPWVIHKLRATVKQDGSIKAKGEGLLLAGGGGIGTRAAITQVIATLLCGGAQFSSAAADLDTAGDFEIRGQLTPLPPNPCINPVLLIRNAGTGNAWFAAGLADD